MDKQQALTIIKTTFENSFDKDMFTGFAKNLLNQIEDAPFTYRGNFIPDAYKPYIASLKRIGKYTDCEHQMDILVVQLKRETSLERARTMQRNFIAWYLNGSRGGEMKDAALSAFVAPNEEDWRFSLVKMDYLFEPGKDGKVKVKEEFTPARRWSFLVGKNESSHTAQSRLVPILADDQHNPTLAHLEEAFNIEKVTKEFFEKYRELFLWTKETLDEIVKQDAKVKADFEAKGVNTVDFAKKLLGQIVFLYFLQKKGWFGVERDAEWGTGTKQFLRELFKERHGQYTNFFNDILEPLFYEALRIDRRHDDDYYSRYNCKIPFLNGGLFDPLNSYDWVHTDILLPNKMFSNQTKTKEGDTGNGILDIFDRYNFTVKEDEPLEKEVAVDPEMLGKVFENLLEVKDRKSKGTYNTPREIVHYMCQQSLINYLETELSDCHSRKSGIPVVSKEDLETLIKYGEQVGENEARVLRKGKETKTYSHQLPESIRKNAKLIDDKLAEIMVCDPAVGSGAFPVGMMSEIVKTRNVLTPFLSLRGAQATKQSQFDDNRTVYNFKRQCIEHSLYGVDIDPGAVEIAKLRLWLSLVVDEEDIKQIKPLPNLDYKIVCGNSLLGVEKDLFNHQLFDELERLKPIYFDETNPTRKQEYKQQIDALIIEITNGHKEFDFEVYFSEVFHEKGGFDVVIANPPYVGESGHKELFRKTKKGPLDKFYIGKMDYFYFFLHLALNLAINNKGEIAFITTNYYLTAMGARKLRADIKQRSLIRRLINFNELRIFESAQGQHNIISLLRKGTGKEYAHTCITDRTGYASPGALSKILRWNDDESQYYEVSQPDLYDGHENYIRHNREQTSANSSKITINTILDKVAFQGEQLGKITNINQGVVSGCDYVSGRNIEKLENREGIEKNDGIFVFDLKNPGDVDIIKSFSSKEKELLRPFFKNSDICRYWCETKASKLLLYLGKNHSNISLYPNIEKHLNRFREILDDRREVKNKRIKYFQLQWYRTEEIFIQKKIVVPYRTNKNTFAINNQEWFCRSDCYVITKKTSEYDLRYILALLNSSLYFHWLYNRGKRKGEILELFQVPLSEIPIKNISTKKQKPFIDLVDKIHSITKDQDCLQNLQKQAKVKALEREIDQLVYQLYDLTPEEIKIVEEENAEMDQI